MTSTLSIDYAGTTLILLADKAIYWPAQRALLIADVHIGKAAAYRRLGQPVPHGTTADNFARIDALLRGHTCERLIVLGDFLHAPESHSIATLDAIGEWRFQHADLDVVLIRGNHDRWAGDPPASLCIHTVAEPLLLGPLALQHEPDAHATHAVIAGHLHPMFRLRGRGREQLRLPCFHIDRKVCLMPAFGLFTGGMNIEATDYSRTYVVADGGLLEV
ncbi:ligase-associated DNA damage response endonuclease PdeM [Pseudomonas matsuisoli]|uniref:DEAD/DEAH box helicase n=1 Tax=Pseudomonas matsuisoli TaxID=1515666 RepID=A0A917PHS7_9PSED|nr:ligase-associated DNA damage response endonuclease PdeM [Pseudomonas matsuisoli]GGJ79492.1 DEAD/DEAH box helicase [Pseudomonas matsuisoli]